MEDAHYVDCPPSPVSLIESLRDVGYSMETAVSDTIDNSITAQARRIWIRFSWNFDDPWVAIVDDGCGMSADQLIEAMRFGSKNPRDTRPVHDLGRFGLGMKTAALSQCRHLTVLSKKARQVAGCEWDLEKISGNNNDQWRLGVLHTNRMEQYSPLSQLYNEYLGEVPSGTIVLWQRMDRIMGQSPAEARERLFDSVMADVRRHLELVFHRYLSPEPGMKKVTVSMNGSELEAFNPFNPKSEATQELDEQRFTLSGEEIAVQPYVLPHHNKVSGPEYERYAMEGGYLQNQGLYIYRNKRLIIKGTWFRLIRKMELNKLIRIRVDIPNTLDHLWKIDVKKSSASPPEAVRAELKQILGAIEIKGRRVYEQRGQRLSAAAKYPVWNRRAAGGSISYEVNREHPMLQQLLRVTPPEQQGLLQNMICLLESKFPVEMFFNDIANKPEQVQNPEFDAARLEGVFDAFVAFWRQIGLSESEIRSTLLSTEPFASNKELAEALLTQRGAVP